MSADEIRNLDFENGASVSLPFRARAIRRSADLVLVLLDPDHYLGDKAYQASQSSGGPPLRNLIAYDKRGRQAWAAELPETVDYYYSIEDGLPIRVLSYSGYRCEIDPSSGRIIGREFLK